MRFFRLLGAQYAEVTAQKGRFGVAEVGLELGLWRDSYRGQEQLWLCWYDAEGRWIAAPDEGATAGTLARRSRSRGKKRLHSKRLEQERQRAEPLAELLRQLGQDPNQL